MQFWEIIRWSRRIKLKEGEIRQGEYQGKSCGGGGEPPGKELVPKPIPWAGHHIIRESRVGDRAKSIAKM